MKKGDLVKRIYITKDYPFDNLKIGDCGIIVKGPYEKNITDLFVSKVPGFFTTHPRVIEIKRVIDILFEDKIYKNKIASDYERVR